MKDGTFLLKIGDRRADGAAVRTSPALVAHLYRRAGFGVSSAEAKRLSTRSWDTLVGELVAGLSARDRAGDAVALPHLTTVPQSNVPGNRHDGWSEYTELIDWWVHRMIVTETPLREKLVLLLHCQFPTSWDKVQWASMMYAQNQIFRTRGAGRWDALVQAVAKDPAMMIWLDTDSSHKRAPNQNFPRELLERFTMGAGHYTQNDVLHAARCFTGWEIDWQSGGYYYNPYDHDDGVKTVLGHRGNLSGEDVIQLATHSSAGHRWIVSRLWSWLAFPVPPSHPVVSSLVRGFARDLDITRLLESILLHPAMRSPEALNGLVKQPIEWVVGTMRQLGLRPAALGKGSLQWYFSLLGQVPFTPPSVGGWGANGYWQSTGTSAGYIQLAYTLAGAADLTEVKNRNGSPAAMIDAVTSLVGLTAMSPSTRAALAQAAVAMKSWGGSWPAQQLAALALLAPELAMN